MRIQDESKDRIVMTMTPWVPWIISCIAGGVFIAIAIFNPVGFPTWAKVVFAGLGVIAPLGFLASHARVHADFNRSAGTLTLTHHRPIGGTTRQTFALGTIVGVEEIIKTDADNSSFHRIELVIHNSGSRTPARLSLTTAPIATDQAESALRLARWLGVPGRAGCSDPD